MTRGSDYVKALLANGMTPNSHGCGGNCTCSSGIPVNAGMTLKVLDEIEDRLVNIAAYLDMESRAGIGVALTLRYIDSVHTTLIGRL